MDDPTAEDLAPREAMLPEYDRLYREHEALKRDYESLVNEAAATRRQYDTALNVLSMVAEVIHGHMTHRALRRALRRVGR